MSMFPPRTLVSLCIAALTSIAVGAPIDYSKTPKDPGVINKEQILYWLVERGELSATATEDERKEAVRKYTANARYFSMDPFQLSSAERQKKRDLRKAKSATLKSAVKTVKVLGVLIDFPDLPNDNNRLTANSTRMYYPSYPVSHYQNMLFSTTGFTGPANQNLMSGYQYYLEESGGSLLYTGKMFGWVRADNNANHYGGNDADDDDKNVPALVREAVTKAVAITANSINLNDYDIEDPSDLDNDGNFDEPDGYIDHVSIFHSSIGEEAGGGVLAKDAIWSHRYNVFPAATITDSFGNSKKLSGYTIQPIDAAAGVVVHEFGHDLGLPDEYDTGGSQNGEPIGFWSVMAGGSWAGVLPGSSPTAFSPYAREYFQNTFGGNWVNQTVVELNDLKTQAQTIALVDAVTHNTSVNQIRVNLPRSHVALSAPYEGSFQYYSGKKDMTTSTLNFSATIPNSDAAQLKLKAHWQIEADWDYAVVKVNGNVIAGNHTRATNPLPERVGVVNYISGSSTAIAGAEGSLGWVDLVFNMAAYKNQTVTIEVAYITDQSVLEKGLIIDGISIVDGSTVAYSDNSETAGMATLTNFSRVGATVEGEAQHYWLQLRSHAKHDKGLGDENYSRGVTLWFGDENYSDNKVGDHPGHGYLAVVDADQNLVSSGTRPSDSSAQVQDAAFSRFDQIAATNDLSIAAIMEFDDSKDYSSPNLPQAGVILPVHGLRFLVSAQATNSTTASVNLTAMPLPLVSAFTFTTSERAVQFTNRSTGGTGNKSYLWNFGNNATSTQASPSYTYASDGTFSVVLQVTDSQGVVHSSTQSVTVAATPPPPPPTPPPASSGGGGGGGSMGLALLALGLLARYRK